jgi:hypothetical protein
MGGSDPIGINPATVGLAGSQMTFVADATATGVGANVPTTTLSAMAPVTAGVQSELADEFAGTGATPTPQTPASGPAPQVDPTPASSPAPSAEPAQTAHPNLPPM